MRKSLSFLLSIALCGIIHSQEAPATNQVQRERRQVARMVEDLRAALIRGDSLTLLELLDPRLSYGHSTGRVENRASFISSVSSGRSAFLDIDLKEQEVIISGNTAIVRHLMNARISESGQPGTLSLRVMLVWQKSKGRWYLLGRQAVKTTS